MQDRYQTLENVGAGGAGNIFRAWDRKLNREVAIKRVKDTDDLLYKKEIMAALKREAVALAAVQHPNVVSLLDTGKDDEGEYMVLEYLKGEDLESVVARGTFLDDDFRRLMTQMLEALAAAHDRGLLHHDIKPSNVRLTWPFGGAFVAKLVDFGLARSKYDGLPIGNSTGERSWGTPHYMAPELFDGSAASVQTDLYALGCLAYFILTGRLAFKGENHGDIKKAHRAHDLTRIEELRPDIPAAVCHWVHWLIQPDVNYRPLNALCALNALESLPRSAVARHGSAAAPASMPEVLFA